MKHVLVDNRQFYPRAWAYREDFSEIFLAHPEISPRVDGRPLRPTKQDVGRLQALLDKAKGREGIKVVRKKLTKAIKALVSGPRHSRCLLGTAALSRG